MTNPTANQTNAPTHPGSPLLEVSHRYGADSAFVLAGGGNTSAKRGDRLWIKASGHALATIGPDGFVEMDRGKLEQMLASDWPAEPTAREALFVERVMAARVFPERGQRPSVESLLHHLMPETLVVHTHPGAVNALTCCHGGEKLTAELFGDDVLWQPYVDPGLILAQSLQDGLVRYRAAHNGRAPSAIFLQNHGLIVGGENAEAIARVSGRIVSALRQRLAECPVESDAAANAAGGRLLKVHAAALASARPKLSIVSDDSEEMQWLTRTKPGMAAAMGGPLTPDQIVYCRSLPLLLDAPAAEVREAQKQWESAWQAYELQHGFAPWVGLIAGAGMLAFRESAKLAEITRLVYADAARICRDATRLGGVRSLGPRDRKFIEEWEVEAHRRSVMSA